MSNTVLKTGCLAYYDTIESGLVPCEVLAITKTVDDLYGGYTCAKIRITESRPAYHKGDVLEEISVKWVIPRSACGTTPLGLAYVHTYAIVVDSEAQTR